MTPSPVDGRPEGLRSVQIATIARATFDGFLESDLTPQGMQAAGIIWAAAFLVAPSLLMPVSKASKYSFLYRYFPERVESAIQGDRLTFILLSAGAIGLVSVVLWDVLFPARRDAFVLTPLPVSQPVQMLGRLAGLVALFAAFAVALNVFPAVLFPIVSSNSVAAIGRGIPAHVAAATAADAFVFFSVTAAQGLVILVFGRRVAARLASAAQAGAILLLLMMLGLMTPLQAFTRQIVEGPATLAMSLTPSAWFLGLYDFIAGSSGAIVPALAWRGALAGLLPPAITAGIYAFGYRRLLVRAVETPSRSTRSIVTRLGSAVIRTVVVRRPEERAIVSFVFRAISRSARHSMLMSLYVGAALALVVTTILPDLVRHGMAALTTPHMLVLAQPLVVSAALAAGVRILITIPGEMGARWVLRTAPLTPRRVDAATHKAMLLLVLPVVVITAGASGSILWGPRIGLVHAMFCGALSLALCELLLMRYRGVPLTRPYVPGSSHFHTLWPAYLGGFSIYCFTMAAIELNVLKQSGPSGVMHAAWVFLGIAIVLWVERKVRFVGREIEVPFEAEIPADEIFRGFNLSEIHAASAVGSHDSSKT